MLCVAGIGIGYIVVNALVCIYYNVIIALSIYYLFASFTTEVPWASCNNDYNTPLCGESFTGTKQTTQPCITRSRVFSCLFFSFLFQI